MQLPTGHLILRSNTDSGTQTQVGLLEEQEMF